MGKLDSIVSVSYFRPEEKEHSGPTSSVLGGNGVSRGVRAFPRDPGADGAEPDIKRHWKDSLKVHKTQPSSSVRS